MMLSTTCIIELQLHTHNRTFLHNLSLWLELANYVSMFSSFSPLPKMCVISGQVDLWTRKSVGCACEHDHAKDKHATTEKNLTTLHNGHHGHQLNCACCVKGGCQCGRQAPNRCSQCGLENHCLNSEFAADFWLYLGVLIHFSNSV